MGRIETDLAYRELRHYGVQLEVVARVILHYQIGVVSEQSLDYLPSSGVIDTPASTLSSLSTSFSAAVLMRTIESAAESKSRYRSPTIVLKSATFASAASLYRRNINQS